MKNWTYVLCGLLLALANRLPAQSEFRDSLGDNFFPVELVLRSGKKLGFTKEQSAQLRQETQEVKGRLTDLQRGLKRETAALSNLSRKERVDGPAVLAQLDRVLELERQIKRTQLELLIRIKNQLTPDQQALLQDLKGRPPKLPEKLRRIDQALGNWRTQGRALGQLKPMRAEIDQLIQQKQFKEAEAAADRMLKLLSSSEQK